MTRVYYAVWWSGRWLSPVDDSPPPRLNASLDQSVYAGADINLVLVRSVLVRGRVLSAGSVDDLLAAIRQAWLSLNSSVDRLHVKNHLHVGLGIQLYSSIVLWFRQQHVRFLCKSK